MSAGSVWGERIEDGRLRARVEADALWVEQAELRGVGGRLALQGRGTRSSLAGRAELTELRLGAIRALTKVWPGVDGRGSLRAEVRGTPDEPILEGSWAITDLRRGAAPHGEVPPAASPWRTSAFPCKLRSRPGGARFRGRWGSGSPARSR